MAIRAFSSPGLLILGLVRGTTSKYSLYNALRSYCESPRLSQPKPPGLSLSLYICVRIIGVCAGLVSKSWNFGSGPLAQYRNLIEQGKLRYDPNQERVASELDKLFGRLEQYEKDMEEYHVYLSLFFFNFGC